MNNSTFGKMQDPFKKPESYYDIFPIIEQRGLSKEWLSAISIALARVPNDAKPDVIGSFSTWNSITNLKMLLSEKLNYGVSISLSDVTISIKNTPQKFIDMKILENPQYQRILDITKKFRLNGFEIRNLYNVIFNNFQIVAYNNKYKSDLEIKSRKDIVDSKYNKQCGKSWFFNKSLEATVYHEMGHVFNNRKFISNRSDWKKLSFKWESESNIEILENPSEAFCEAFAAYFVSPKTLPEYITNYIKSII